MALSHLLQPNSTLRACTIGFAAARVRFCTSRSSAGDGDSLPPLKEEAAAVDTEIVSPENTESEAVLNKPGFHEAISLGNVMNIKAKYGDPRKPHRKTLSGLFIKKKDDPTETMVRIDAGEDIVDCLWHFKKDKTPSQSTGCQNGLTVENSAPQSAEVQATVETDGLRNLASVFHSAEASNETHEEQTEKDFVKNIFESITTRLHNSLSDPSKLGSINGLNKDNLSNANVQRSERSLEDKETSKSGSDSSELKEQKQHPEVSLAMSNEQRSKKQVEDKETSKSGFDSNRLNEQKQHPEVSLVTSNVQRSNKQVEDKETSKSGFDSSWLNEQRQHLEVSLPTSNVRRSNKQVEDKEMSKSGFVSSGLNEQIHHLEISLPTSNVRRSDKQVEGKETSKSGFDSSRLKEQKQHPKVSLPMSNMQRSNEQVKGNETKKSGFDSGESKEQKQRPNVSLPKSDVQRSDKGIEDKEISKSGFDSGVLKEQKQCPKVSLPTINRDQRQRQRQNSDSTESEENKVLVRFLSSSLSTGTIFSHFKSCGQILKIECPYVSSPLLKTACIHFRTRDGLENSIRKSGSYFHWPIIVESATPENTTTTVHVPSLLGDPDVPAALVRNPTRTIKIEHLTQEISSHHIIEALAFCKSKVSGYFLGSSHSVVYVELETEIGKERALAEQSINVLGRHLVISRIDCPRTTVARITSRELLGKNEVRKNEVISICKSLGDICLCLLRTPYILDVHFRVAEWPNMWKILNRLNGCIVNGTPLQAEAAPVFPPEVLLALWRHPEERKHLEATAKSLLLRLGSQLDTSELSFIQNDIFST